MCRLNATGTRVYKVQGTTRPDVRGKRTLGEGNIGSNKVLPLCVAAATETAIRINLMNATRASYTSPSSPSVGTRSSSLPHDPPTFCDEKFNEMCPRGLRSYFTCLIFDIHHCSSEYTHTPTHTFVYVTHRASNPLLTRALVAVAHARLSVPSDDAGKIWRYIRTANAHKSVPLDNTINVCTCKQCQYGVDV
jgi:hypothetical protein